MNWLEWVIGGISILLIIVGFLGAFLPVIPGPFLIVAAALLHKIFLPQYLTWWTVSGIIIGGILCALVDWIFFLLGMKWSGASKWGFIGASVGLIVGMVFTIPGMIIGAILGAIAGEYFVAQRQIGSASWTGIMAVVGMVIGTVIKLVIILLMIAAFLFDWFM